MVVSRGRTRDRGVGERGAWAPFAIGRARILGAVGAAGVIVSLFLAWSDPDAHPSDISAAFLWDRGATSDPSLLIFMVPLAVILVIGVFAPLGAGVRMFGAVGVLVVTGLFAYQLYRAVDAFGGALDDALDTGFYFAAIGGLLALVSALMSSSYRRRAAV